MAIVQRCNGIRVFVFPYIANEQFTLCKNVVQMDNNFRLKEILLNRHNFNDELSSEKNSSS